MRNIQESIISMINSRNARRRLMPAVCMIAAALVFAVVWSLHINGITLASADPTCGMEEHIHTDECYAWVAVETEGTESVEVIDGTEGTEETAATEIIDGSESAGEGTESVTDMLGEDTTEEATEEVTEEATESPQPGDIRIANGVTYVYELVCGLEEHTHMDACYESDDSEEDTDAAEETGSDETAEDEEEEISTTAGVANVKSLGVSNSSDDDDEEEVVSVASLEEEASDGSDAEETTSDSSSASGNYYISTPVSYGDNLDTDSNYIIYTIINGTYYVLSADGSLVSCETVASASEAGSSGMYYLSDEDKFAYIVSGAEYPYYCWTLSGSSGSYSAYNEATEYYLAPSCDGDLEIGTAFTAHTGELTLSGDFKVVYTFTNRSTGSYAHENYIVEMVSDGVYLDVRADNASNAAWKANADENDSVTLGEGTSDDDWLAVMQAGATVTATIEKVGSNIQITRQVEVNGTTYTFTATATMTEYADAAVTVYLTGENCVITDLCYTVYTNSYSDASSVSEATWIASTDENSSVTAAVSTTTLFSTVEKMLALSAESTAEGAGSTYGTELNYSYLSVSLGEDSSGDGAAAWVDSDSGLTFYFATTEEPSYTFADQTTLAYAAANQDESYLIYTKIENSEALDGYDYYVVQADGDNTLVKCTYLENVDTSSASFLNDTSATGIYCWKDSSGEMCFKYTSANASSDSFDNYRWTFTSTDSSIDADSGSGTYTVYNSKKSVYLAPEELGVSETVAGGDNNYNYSASQNYSLADEDADSGVVIYTITCTALPDSDSYSGQFWVDAFDSNDKYLTLTSVYGYWGDIVNNAKSTSASGSALTISTGETYTVFVSRSLEKTTDDDGTTYAYTYTITYYNNSGTQVMTYTATTSEASANAGYTRFAALNGTYDISVTYATLKSDSDANGTACSGITANTSIDGSSCSDVTTALTTEGAYTSDVTLSGDFDVTWYLTAGGGSGSSNTDYYVLVLDNGGTSDDTLETVYVYADNTAVASGYNTDSASVNTSIDYWDTSLPALGSDGLPTSSGWNSWRTAMNAAPATTTTYIQVNVKRVGNVVTVTRTVYRNTAKRSTFTTVIRDSAFSGNDVTMRMTAKKSKYTITSLADNSDGQTYDFVSNDVYEAVGSTIQSIELTASGSAAYDFTATVSTVDVSNLVLYLNGTSSANWATDETTVTLYLANVQEYTAWFDGTNGGMATSNSTDTAVVSSSDAYGNTFTVTALTEDVATAPTYVSSTLRGWYDIYTNTYYEPGEEFELTDNTVLYADWEVESYDMGSNSESDHVVDSISTSSFVKINMFDFNELFNIYSVALTDSTSSLTAADHSEYFYNVTLDSVANDTTIRALDTIKSLSTLDFLFFRNESAGNIIDYPSGRSDRNGNDNDGATAGIIGSAGDTSVTEDSISLLDVLFSTTNTVDTADDKNSDDVVYGKTYVGSADYLFQYNSATGYYYYDSAKNATAYNQSAGRFYVYNYLTAVNSGGSTSDFLPYNYLTYANSYTSSKKLEQNYVNYWFGMSTELTFYLPDDVSSGNNKDITGNYDMTFKFSGDDDVWVFVDGVLVLDLGGVHGIVYGEIDFTTGEVVIVNKSSDITYTTREEFTIIDYSEGATLSEQGTAATYISNLKAGTHTLTFYYLERGSGQSNAAIYTNISSATYNLTLNKVDEDTGNGLEGAEFTFYSDNTFADTSKVLLATEQNGDNMTSTFAAGDTVYGLVEGTLYYVLETAAPDGYTAEGKYFTVYLSGSTLTITVYDSTNSNVELYTYEISYDSTTGTTYTYTKSNSVTNSSTWSYVWGDEGNASIEAKVTGGAVSYYSVAFKIANTKEYELPSTGSMGIFPYRAAGKTLVLISVMGLLLMALHEYLRSCRLRMKEGGKEADEWNIGNNRKIHARTRDHPRERSMERVRARDRPNGDGAVSVHDGPERNRGSGPGRDRPVTRNGVTAVRGKNAPSGKSG